MPTNLDSPEAVAAAERLNAFRRNLIEDRWLSTIILSIHLELEAMLEYMLVAHGGELTKSVSSAGFAKKLSMCQAAILADTRLVAALKAVNNLRNELAHRLDNKPTTDSILRFIEAISAIHPIQVVLPGDPLPVNLHTLEQITEHFSRDAPSEMECIVFTSLMLLRAKVLVLMRAMPSPMARSTVTPGA